MVGWLTRLFSLQAAPAKASVPEAVEEKSKPAEQEPPAPEPPLPTESALPGFQPISWAQKDNLNATLLSWLFEGYDRSKQSTNKLEKEILAALEKIIVSNQAASNMVRRMPGVIPQLLQSLRTEDFSGAELARKISNDVVLVAEVIRIANSALYKSTDAIGSIEHAILVIGQTGLRQLITSVAFKPIIDLKSGNYTRTIAPKIWEYSEQCAIANRILAEREPVVAFEAFLAGLTQNVGLIVSLRIIDQFADDTKSIGSSSFCSALVACGHRISASIGREWNFPESVITAIEEQENTNKNADISPLGLLLETGDYVSKLSVLADHQRLRADDPDLLRGLSDKALACLQEMQPLNMVQPQE